MSSVKVIGFGCIKARMTMRVGKPFEGRYLPHEYLLMGQASKMSDSPPFEFLNYELRVTAVNL